MWLITRTTYKQRIYNEELFYLLKKLENLMYCMSSFNIICNRNIKAFMYKTFSEIKHMLATILKVCFITCLKLPNLNNFGGKFHEQCDSIAMGSVWEPALANVFIFHFENIFSSFQRNCLQAIHWWCIFTLSNKESFWKNWKLSQTT